MDVLLLVAAIVKVAAMVNARHTVVKLVRDVVAVRQLVPKNAAELVLAVALDVRVVTLDVMAAARDALLVQVIVAAVRDAEVVIRPVQAVRVAETLRVLAVDAQEAVKVLVLDAGTSVVRGVKAVKETARQNVKAVIAVQIVVRQFALVNAVVLVRMDVKMAATKVVAIAVLVAVGILAQDVRSYAKAAVKHTAVTVAIRDAVVRALVAVEQNVNLGVVQNVQDANQLVKIVVKVIAKDAQDARLLVMNHVTLTVERIVLLPVQQTVQQIAAVLVL